MLKISHVKEVDGLQLPQEVIAVIRDAVTILDEEYGEEREESGYGGYVLVLESDDEMARLEELGIDVATAIPEYVDVIECLDGQAYTSSLVLLGSDFGIVLIASGALPVYLHWKKYITKKTEH